MNNPDFAPQSGWTALLDMHTVEWTEGFARTELELKPHHLNASGVVHGGVLMTMLDSVSGRCGLYCNTPNNRRYGMTVSMTCNFTGQSRTGKLIGTARRTAGGTRTYFTTVEIHTGKGDLVATGSGVHRYRSGSETIEGVPMKAKADAGLD
jgi:uncharacterized protein (TIGR00369 family)